MAELTTSAVTTLEKRYLRRNDSGEVIETPDEMWMRIADALGKDDEQRQDFHSVLSDLDFLANSPLLMNAGTPLNQLSACFVLPIEDSMSSIYGTITDTAMIQKTGGGTGFSFGRLRPRGDHVYGTQGVASGPVSFLKVFDASTGQIKQGGKRRGANMAVLPTTHPDIFEFIDCKDVENTQVTNFNISLWATDEFMRAVEDDKPWDLINPRTGEVVRTVQAAEIFERATQKCWETGDPGIIFADTMERGNPTPWIGQYEATNPCAEQPLLPYEACNLGSVNLKHCVDQSVSLSGWDTNKLIAITEIGVEMLDRAIDLQHYTLPQIEAMHKDGNRKIGIGIMGYADAMSMMELRYGSDEAIAAGVEAMRIIQETAHGKSYMMGRELNAPFPNYNGDMRGGYAMTKWFPEDHYYHEPRRHATVTTIAPTGTIGIIAGTSGGVEPHFALAVKRTNVLGGEDLYDFNPILEEVLQRIGETNPEAVRIRAYVEGTGVLPDWAPEELRNRFPTVMGNDITVEQHLETQVAFQRHTDNGVSKTINLPESGMVQDVRYAYMQAWRMGIKAVAVYRDQSKVTQVLNAPEDKGKVTPKKKGIVSKEHSGVPMRQERPEVLSGHTEQIPTGLGTLYLTINHNGEDVPMEVFAQIGRAGSEVAAFTEGIARSVSLALQYGIPVKEVANQLIGIGGAHANGFGERRILSVPDAIGKSLMHHVTEQPDNGPSVVVVSPERIAAAIGVDICPECNQGGLVHEAGCINCKLCGYSSC